MWTYCPKIGLISKDEPSFVFRMCDTETAVMTLIRSGWDLETRPRSYRPMNRFRRIRFSSDFIALFISDFFSGSYPINIGFRVGDIFAEI